MTMSRRRNSGVISRFLEKHLLVQYVLTSFAKVLLGVVIAAAVLFGILKAVGKYSALESRLDLKYDSPWLTVPMAAALALALIALVIGLILYFYKYKRIRTKSSFYNALKDIVNEKRKG